ncbi:serine/threonine-protein kinase Nek2 [Anabrus simplex]|uniref:serine/threonine-protein kinase Nek2 n=1 Tax=Anabrus simplex TaxID=316456 RepID=UPI0035A26914
MENCFEDYDVLSVIGTGTFGTCYKVQKKSTGQIFVWKAINYGKMTKEKKLRLVSEVNLLSELHHSNIVRYYDRIIHKPSATLYIIMEWCEGGDLATLIAMCKRTNKLIVESFVWRVLYQTACALQACHSYLARGTIMHRDIKPANVFLDGTGNVKLGDFGLARVLQDDISFAHSVVGTPYYMSPEMIKGNRYNKKSDIWSLGCLIYEMCVLMPPFSGPSIPELAQKIEEGKFERIPSYYSEDLQKMISFMLRVDHVIRPTVEVILHHPTVMSHLAQDTFKTKENTGVVENAEKTFEERLEAITFPNPVEDKSIKTQCERREPDPVISKIDILRQREAAVRAKELAIIERERAVEKREREVGLLSRIIKEKMERANVYLNQCRDSRSVAGSVRQHPSVVNVNLDTSFSADPGDSPHIRKTSARMKPEKVEKPATFRRSASLGRHVHFGTLPSLNPKKYSTLPELHKHVQGTEKDNVKPSTDLWRNDKVEGGALLEGCSKPEEDNIKNGILCMLDNNPTSNDSKLPNRNPTSIWLANKKIAYSCSKLSNKENIENVTITNSHKRKSDGSIIDAFTRKVGALSLR